MMRVKIEILEWSEEEKRKYDSDFREGQWGDSGHMVQVRDCGANIWPEEPIATSSYIISLDQQGMKDILIIIVNQANKLYVSNIDWFNSKMLLACSF